MHSKSAAWYNVYMRTNDPRKRVVRFGINDIKSKNRTVEICIIIVLVIWVIATYGYAIYVIIPAWFVYEIYYFRSKQFKKIKNSLQKNTDDCNALNHHIEDLKNTYVNIRQSDYGCGEGNFTDLSRYNFKRVALQKASKSERIHNCSLSVIRNAQNQPFRYICKYFNIKQDEETLSEFEKILNNFAAAEQGKELLERERNEILEELAPKIPLIFATIRKKTFEKKLGFEKIDFSDLYFPRYGFQYISAGGNKSELFTIKMDIPVLERFIGYLSELVKFRKSVQGQRALMTIDLRAEIKERDKFTCKKCGNSIKNEPNLLLEIDHIIPLSKGGLTTKDNLQTLCWRCNRQKGAKIE